MRAAWMVRSRQMESRFAFWLAALGYNRNDRSLQHRIYLIYALVFMAIWVFAVFTLFAGSGKLLLKMLNPASPAAAAADIATKITLAWLVFTLVKVSRRSPLVFSEEDANLICQTPVSRQAVALAWFPADWLEGALPFWAGMITLGFSLAELGLKGQVSFLDVPSYVLTGLRALGEFLPVHLGLLAALWALGTLRLCSKGEAPWLRWAAWAGAAVIVIAALKTGPWQVILLPVSFPMQAAFHLAPASAGLAVGIVIALLGLLALWAAAGSVNLSLAAQETAGREAQQAAARVGAFEMAQSLRRREQLGKGRPPSRLPVRPGVWMLPWKDVVQSGQMVDWQEILGWLQVLAAALGTALLPAWEARSLAAILWAIFLGQITTRRLRDDLAHWSLLRQLPLDSGNLILADLGLPWALGLALTWLALIPGLVGMGAVGLPVFVLAPVMAAAVILAAAYDVLHQSTVSVLMAGSSPTVTGRGAIIGLLFAAAPLGLLYWLGTQGTLDVSVALPLAIGAGVLTAWIAWLLAVNALQNIE